MYDSFIQTRSFLLFSYTYLSVVRFTPRMIEALLLLLSFFVQLLTAEPPVNSYLPPSGQNGRAPDSTYGPPGFQPGAPLGQEVGAQNNGFGGQFPQRGGLNGGQSGRIQPNALYGAPNGGIGGLNGGQNGKPSALYGAPNGGSGGGLNGGQNGRIQPSALYGAPNGGNGGRRNGNNGRRPNAKYGAPNGNNGARNNRPSSSYGAPTNGFGGNGGRPSPTYGAPGGNTNGGGYQNGGPSPVYGAPNQFGNGYDEGQPAKYEFSYEVSDDETGTQFSHQESRDGDVATGEYDVLLPDGRKQVVTYQADTEGYKPEVSYEEGGYPASQNDGYPSGGPGGNGGHSNGGYSNGGFSRRNNNGFLNGGFSSNNGGPY